MAKFGLTKEYLEQHIAMKQYLRILDQRLKLAESVA